MSSVGHAQKHRGKQHRKGGEADLPAVAISVMLDTKVRQAEGRLDNGFDQKWRPRALRCGDECAQVRR